MLKKSLFLWCAIIPLAIANGLAREILFTPLLGARYALLVSGLLLCLLIFAICLLFIPKLGKSSAKIYWGIGILWGTLTIAFETCLGLAAGRSASEIIETYDITTGNLWLAVLASTVLSPWVSAKIRRVV